ncbi:T9SS type A sorting domain-containing protein [Robiginitalea sp. SC105]|uniref:T9SS type A sorting domain-containing protein n=1 Tax=Robiginitalea sp. SC105 TaxID=2762332 RepID=UPI00163B48D7|nr:T9SS type A sorting domain-containing protein [Robiginitalea sp. SC105]MBC2837902.1 T9SS type A sorting domain-containing protein [Robiginitalea sp. SC105]
MKHLYTLLFLLFLTAGFSQQEKSRGDIEGFKLYPNPVTQGKVYIVTASNAPKNVHIYDVLGTPVLKTTILGTELNLTGLDAGVYLIQVYEKDRVATRKLIVK